MDFLSRRYAIAESGPVVFGKAGFNHGVGHVVAWSNAAVTVGLHKSERVTVVTIEIKRSDAGSSQWTLTGSSVATSTEIRRTMSPLRGIASGDAVCTIRGGRR
jgi:hypothetical protein